MRLNLIIISAILFLFTYQTVDAQKVLLVQKPGTTTRFLYKVGDQISVRIGEPAFTVSGQITYIDDSVCTVNKDYTFHISKVLAVTRTRHFLHNSWRKLFLASALYAGGSMINRSLNDEKPLIDNTIPIVSGSFIVLGTTAYLLRYRHLKMEDGWNLKVLDFDIFKENEQK